MLYVVVSRVFVGLCTDDWRGAVGDGSDMSQRSKQCHLTSFNSVPKVGRLMAKNNHATASISKGSRQEFTASTVDILKKWLFVHRNVSSMYAYVSM